MSFNSMRVRRENDLRLPVSARVSVARRVVFAAAPLALVHVPLGRRAGSSRARLDRARCNGAWCLCRELVAVALDGCRTHGRYSFAVR